MQKLDAKYVLAEQAKQIAPLLAHPAATIVNIQLRAGEVVPEHNANNVVVIIVRRGEVRFQVEGVDHLLSNEAILVMEPLEMHHLEAVTDVDIIVVKINLA